MDEINGALAFSSTLDNKDILRRIEEIKQKIKGTTEFAESESGRIDGTFKSIAAGMAGAFTFAAAAQFRQKLIDVRGEFQKFEAILANSLGSQREAAASMEMLSDVASKTPFQLDQLTGSYVKLVNQGFKPTREELIKLGDLASSTGKGFDQLVEAVLDAQTGQFERLKEFGIKASASGDQIAFSFKGVTTTVQNSGAAIRDYMLSLGDMQGVKGSMQAISKTLVGQVSNLEDAITAMFNKIGSQSEGFLSGSISATKYLVDNYTEIGKAVEMLVITYGAYKAAVVTTTVVESVAISMSKGWTASMALQFKWLQITTAAQNLLNKTMLANPYVLVATAIAGVVASLVIYGNKLTAAEKLEKQHLEIRQQYTETLDEEKAKTDALISTVNNESLSKKTRLKALQDLKQEADGYLDNLTIENSRTAEGARLLNEYNKAFERKIYLQANQEEKIKLIKEKRELEKQKNELQDQIDALDKQKNSPQLTQGSTLAPASSSDVADNAKSQAQNQRTKLLQQQTAIALQLSKLDKEEADLQAKTIETTKKAVKGYESVGDKIAEIDIKLKGLQKQRNDLNANDANSINAIDRQIDALNKQKQKLENSGKSSNATEKEDFSKLLEDKKSMYERYYLMLRTMGKSTANAEFKTLIDNGKTFEDYLKSSIDKIESKKDAISAKDKTRLSLLKTYYAEVLYEKSKAEIDFVNPKPSKTVKSNEGVKGIMNSFEMASNHEMQVIRQNSADIIEMGRNELRAFMSKVKTKIDLMKAEGKNVEELESIYARASASLKTINDRSSQMWADPSASFVKLTQSVKEFDNASTLAEQNSAAKDLLSSASSAAIELQNDLTGVIDIMYKLGALTGEQADSSVQALNSIMGISKAMVDVSLGIISGNIDQVIKGAISYISNVISLLDRKTTKIASRQREVTNEIDKMSKAYQSLGYYMKFALGTDAYKTQLEQYKINVAEMAKYDELINLERSKKRKKQNQDDIDSWNDAKQQLVQQNLDIQQNITDSLAQTNARDLAGRLADSITEAFYNGTDAALAWGAVTDQVLANAVKNALKLQLLEKPMGEAVAKLAGDMQDGILSETEQKDFRAKIDKAAQDFNLALSTYKDLFDTASTPSAKTGSDLTGAIKGIQEETAGLIAGQMNAMRMNQAEALDITRKSLMHLANIDANTYKLHAIESTLGKIERNTTPKTNIGTIGG